MANKFLDKLGLKYFWKKITNKIETTDKNIRNDLVQPDVIYLNDNDITTIGNLNLLNRTPQGCTLVENNIFVILSGNNATELAKYSYPSLEIQDILTLPSTIHGNGVDYNKVLDRIVITDVPTKTIYCINPNTMEITNSYTYTGQNVSAIAFSDDGALAYTNLTGSNNYLLYEKQNDVYCQFGLTNGTGGIGNSGRQDMCGVKNYGFAHLCGIVGTSKDTENIIKVFSNYGTPFVTFKLPQVETEPEGLCFDLDRNVFIYTTLDGTVFEANVSDLFDNTINSATENSYGGNYIGSWMVPNRAAMLQINPSFIVDATHCSILRRIHFPSCNGCGTRLAQAPIISQTPSGVISTGNVTAGGDLRCYGLRTTSTHPGAAYVSMHYKRTANYFYLTLIEVCKLGTNTWFYGIFDDDSTDQDIIDFLNDLSSNFGDNTFKAANTSLWGPIRWGDACNTTASVFPVR